MALSCTESLLRIEESVLQQIHATERRQKEKCKKKKCNFWTLCLNKLACWLVWLAYEIVKWVLVIAVRYLAKVVCVFVSIVVGIATLNGEMLGQAFADLLGLVIDAISLALGGVIFLGAWWLGTIQGVLGLQGQKRRLNKEEREILGRIYWESMNYDAIRLIIGDSGAFTLSGAPVAFGYRIYIPEGEYSFETLVHESVHVWQFQFGGPNYIGNSVINQALAMLGAGDRNAAYEWEPAIGTEDGAWYLMDNIEHQAKFVEDAWRDGEFIPTNPPIIVGQGAFFAKDAAGGTNRFVSTVTTEDYTIRANSAWRVLRTG